MSTKTVDRSGTNMVAAAAGSLIARDVIQVYTSDDPRDDFPPSLLYIENGGRLAFRVPNPEYNPAEDEGYDRWIVREVEVPDYFVTPFMVTNYHGDSNLGGNVYRLVL